MDRRAFLLSPAGYAALPVAASPSAAAGDPFAIGSRRELFVDRELIAELRGAELRLALPVDAGPVLSFDRPWEGAFSAYATVLALPGGGFALYYRGSPAAGQDGNAGEVTCMAESRDGVQWTRPDLGGRNVILSGDPPYSHNFSPFVDTRPGVPDEARFKALAGVHKTGLAAFVSPDGRRWRKLRAEPVFPPPQGFSLDSQNIAFWSPHEGRYVLYYRTWKAVEGVRYRWVSRAVSDDFLNWTPEGEVSYGGAPPEHLYTNQTSAYFRAPHLYVGVCARFFPGRQVLNAGEARALGVQAQYFKDCSDAVLVTSRGGRRFERTFMEAFVRPGLGLENWVSRSNYPALNVVQTSPAAMSFYVNRNYGQPTAYLRRYELRLDGFASAHAGYGGGEVVTKALTFTGSALELNYATSAAGSVRVEMQDAAGRPVPGFALADAAELIGDQIARDYQWKSGGSVGALAGKPVRLRFVLKDADLFAFRFRG